MMMADTWEAQTSCEANAKISNEDVGSYETREEATPQPIQEKRINKKKLQELQSSGKTLDVFVRNSKQGGLLPSDAIKNVPKDVAAICSDLLYDKLQNPQYFLVISKQDVLGHKYVFDWIKKCGAEQNVVNIGDVNDLVTENEGFAPLISVLKAARHLKIPEASFSKFLFIKARSLAKDILVPLDLVNQAYDTGHEQYLGDLGLRELFIESIFEHWYNYKLDDEAHDGYMEQLTSMRENIPELNEDLQTALVAKDERIRVARKKRRARNAENAAGGDETFPGNAAGEAADSFGGGWKNTDTIGRDVKAAWADEPGAINNGQIWARDPGFGDVGDVDSNDWADEVNANSAAIPVSQASVTTSAW